jgi:catechol 1,2-dioxygenase
MKANDNSIPRRDFLKRTSLFAIGVSMPLLHSCDDEKKSPVPDPECETTDDILGPFYKAGAPFQENVIPEGTGAGPLRIEGKVMSECVNPVQDAIVEIWNADENGDYDTSEAFHFRGRFQTSGDGSYRFVTIVPGRYLNGGTYRPSHIHFRITAPGHQELVSQIYFTDDPFIETDPWASADKARERILDIVKATDGTDIVTFDIFLNKLG